MKLYGPDTKFDFGKYEGKTVEDIIIDDPQYIDWCLEKVNGFNLTKPALEMMNEAYEGGYEDGKEMDDFYGFDGW